MCRMENLHPAELTFIGLSKIVASGLGRIRETEAVHDQASNPDKDNGRGTLRRRQTRRGPSPTAPTATSPSALPCSRRTARFSPRTNIENDLLQRDDLRRAQCRRQAIALGNRSIVAVVLYTRTPNALGRPAVPAGNSCPSSNPEMEILCISDGEEVLRFTLHELLPKAFTIRAIRSP
jgi:hypothetical protein